MSTSTGGAPNPKESPLFAFKHHTLQTPALITELDAATEDLNSRHKAAQDLAASFPFPVKAKYRRDPFTGRHSEIFLVPDGTPSKSEVPEGWRYLKTRDTMEPARGAVGKEAVTALEAVQPPTRQPRNVLRESGMPESFTKPGPNFTTYMVVPTYFHHDGVIYSLVNVEKLVSDFAGEKEATFDGGWVECPVSEYYAAYEQIKDAA